MKATLRVLCISFASMAFVACDDDRKRSRDDDAPTCDGTSVAYGAIEKGAVLCDKQHLVAFLDPRRNDTKAGLGALDIPFRVTEETQRDYCFTDDNSEGHTLVLRDDTGKVVLDLTTKSRCTQATLPVGTYSLRLTHEKPGAIDDTPDVIHTKLESTPARSTLTFQSNVCKNCDIGGDWPCASPGPGKPFYCGFVGDYTGTRFYGGDCRTDPSHDCVLAGSFDGASVTRTNMLSRRLVLGTPDGMATVPSTFDYADFTDYEATLPDTLVLRDLTRLTGNVFVNFRHVINEAPAVVVQWFTGYNLMRFAASHTGPPLRGDLSIGWSKPLTEFSGITLDLSRVIPFPALVDGRRSYSGLKFANAKLSGLRSFRDGTERIEMRNVDFTGARLSDSDLDVDSLEGTSFAGATLTNVKIGAHALPSHEDVVASGVSFAGATLDGVTLGMDPPETATSSAPQLFDGAGLDATGAIVRSLTVKHAKLDDSKWRGATISPATPAGFSFVASDSAFDGATFDVVAAFDRVVWRRCSLGKSTAPPLRSFTLSLLRAAPVVSDWNLDGSEVIADGIGPSTFERCSFVGATLAGNFGLRAFEGCSFRGARFVSGSSLARTTLRSCDFSEADMSADMSSVSATSTPFIRASFTGTTTMGGATFTDGSFDGARFCDGANAAGASFDRVSLRGAVMPAAEEPAYQESPTEVACRGTIPLAQRRVLGTSSATACPDGLSGPCNGATNDARWTPVRGQSRPVCCTPSPSAPTCVRKVKSAPCESACDCTSLTCIAGKCG